MSIPVVEVVLPAVRRNPCPGVPSIDSKRVNFELSVDQHTKLKIYAAKQGKTIKELLTEYVASLPE